MTRGAALALGASIAVTACGGATTAGNDSCSSADAQPSDSGILEEGSVGDDATSDDRDARAATNDATSFDASSPADAAQTPGDATDEGPDDDGGSNAIYGAPEVLERNVAPIPSG
jgi:hypothetical protein